MSGILLVPPYEGPWDTTREGGVKSATGELIGYCRYQHLGDLARMQATSRWWAASPSLADAAVALVVASHGLAVAAGDPARIEAGVENVKAAHRLAYDGLTRLRDPLITHGAGLNAPVSEALERIGRLWR